MPRGSPGTHPILQPAVLRCFCHPNNASSIPVSQQYHKSSRTPYQVPEAGHTIAAPPCRGAQSSLSCCCWMATCLPPGHRGGRGAHPHPQPSGSPPAHSESRAALQTPPWGPPPKRVPALPSKGGGKRCALPHGVQIPGSAAHPKDTQKKHISVQHHQRLQWSCPAPHRRSNTSSR